CLSGIPPLTAYWVKSAMDGVMHSLEHEFGYLPLALLVLTSTVYSAFLAKFLSLNFIKGKEVHLHPHGGQLMSLAYMIMALMLFLLLYLYLATHGFTKLHEFQHFFEEGFVTSSLAVGIIVLVSYTVTLYKPRLESPIGKALGDRLYMPFLNDLIVPKIGWAFAKLVDYGNRLIDFTCHQAIPSLFEVYSLGIRSVQSGSVERYVKVVVAVVLIVFLISTAVGVIL
ncbi:MAG: NADH-quinone oxidoreductase subunit L, partial [Archaeoglobaceae archaeon]